MTHSEWTLKECTHCPICGLVFEGMVHCGDDDLVYLATYGDPQPEGYPMTIEEWNAKNPDQRKLDA